MSEKARQISVKFGMITQIIDLSNTSAVRRSWIFET